MIPNTLLEINLFDKLAYFRTNFPETTNCATLASQLVILKSDYAKIQEITKGQSRKAGYGTALIFQKMLLQAITMKETQALNFNCSIPLTTTSQNNVASTSTASTNNTNQPPLTLGNLTTANQENPSQPVSANNVIDNQNPKNNPSIFEKNKTNLYIGIGVVLVIGSILVWKIQKK